MCDAALHKWNSDDAGPLTGTQPSFMSLCEGILLYHTALPDSSDKESRCISTYLPHFNLCPEYIEMDRSLAGAEFGQFGPVYIRRSNKLMTNKRRSDGDQTSLNSDSLHLLFKYFDIVVRRTHFLFSSSIQNRSAAGWYRLADHEVCTSKLGSDILAILTSCEKVFSLLETRGGRLTARRLTDFLSLGSRGCMSRMYRSDLRPIIIAC